MRRFVFSLAIGLATGILAGLILGYVVFPVEYIDSPMSNLAQRYKDDYTVMVAKGFADERDVEGALQRLAVLGVENVPEYVQSVTERYITNSRDVEEIRYLVILSEGFGRLTPIMEPYRQIGGGS
jgi:hypothetical protein